jgi:hypothetical protein
MLRFLNGFRDTSFQVITLDSQEMVYHYELTLKMEAGGSSETLVAIYQTIWHHVVEDSDLTQLLVWKCGILVIVDALVS